MLTKEQLFASLQYDEIKIDSDLINKAKSGSSKALLAIGFKYDSIQDFSKAMAWYQLSANYDNGNAQNSIAILYYEGNGVPQDFNIAMEYYLKAAKNKDCYSMANIGYQFDDGRGVPVDHYKALEWYIKSGEVPKDVTELNRRGVHLTNRINIDLKVRLH